MSMVQSVMIDNEANNVAITVQGQNPPGVKFGIQPEGSQIIPIFAAGTTLSLSITLASVQLVDTQLAFQIFNTWVPPAQWVANLAIAGNVNAQVSGIVNVSGSVVSLSSGVVTISAGTVAISGGTVNISNSAFAIAAMATGGANAALHAGLTNTVLSIKNNAAGCLKALDLDNALGAIGSVSFVQVFDAATPGAVTLGSTIPKLSYPIAGGAGRAPSFPPEGWQFSTGCQIAATSTAAGAGAPALAVNVNSIYF